MNDGRAGSLGIALEGDMQVSSASKVPGLKGGDLIVLVKTTERDDSFLENDTEETPVRNRRDFMAACGPASDVFEGTIVPVTVIRDEAAQKLFKSKCEKATSRKAWLAEVKKHETMTFDVKVKPETEGVRATRLKTITKIKTEKNLDKMDVKLVINFMTDPHAARAYASNVFNTADKDKSSMLSTDEIVNVFIEIADHIGCKMPSKSEIKKLTKLMDLNNSGHVSFNEFFPIFRWKMIQLISDMIED